MPITHPSTHRLSSCSACWRPGAAMARDDRKRYCCAAAAVAGVVSCASWCWRHHRSLLRIAEDAVEEIGRGVSPQQKESWW
jgi:hypothetical protein